MAITLAFLCFLVVWLIVLFPLRAWIQKKQGLPQTWSLKSISKDYKKSMEEVKSTKKSQNISLFFGFGIVNLLLLHDLYNLFLSEEATIELVRMPIWGLYAFCIGLLVMLIRQNKSIERLEEILGVENKDEEHL